MLSLLGTPRFADQPVPLERVTYLLALLACREEWISRDELVLLLWGDVDEAAGRQRLRQLLYRARSFAHADGLEADAARVRLVGSSDVRLFRSALRDQRHRDAALLYDGEFLHGVQLPDHPELEEFFAAEREELASLYRRAVLNAAATLEPTTALALIERAVTLDPSSDELVLEGLRRAAGVDAALGQRLYNLHARALRSLGVEPHPELQAMLESASVTAASAASAPRQRPPATPSKLPVPTTAFIGRQRELREIGERFTQPEVRLLTIVGPGGAGKTRLSLEVAGQAGTQMPDGAIFAALAAIEDTQLVPSALLEVLGVQGGSDPLETLLTTLKPQCSLLVLDNLEHLPNIAPLVARLLEECAGLRILCTSREALGLRAEHVIELEGLPAPDTLFPLETQDAAALFLRAARRVDARFRLDQDSGKPDLQSFTRIYNAVSGMPLGLELAASWVRVMSPNEIANELEHSLDLLEVDAADLPARHRSFAAAFRSSWTLLRPNEQQALARMSVFRGGFTREMAAEVAGSSLPTLLRLVNKSLVSRRETRFFLHEMIRQYAERELSAAERQRSLEALSNTCLELAKIYAVQYKGEQQVTWNRRLEQENDNIRSVLNWSLDHDVRQGADTAGHLEHFWYIRGYHREGLEWAERFLSRSETTPRDSVRLALLWVLVSLNKELGNYDASHHALLEYIQIAGEIGTESALASGEKFMGLLTRERGDMALAREHLTRAKAMFEAIGDKNQIGICWNDIGITHGYEDDFLEARRCFTQSLEIKREIGDRQGIAYALGNLGLAAAKLGDPELDRVLQEESLRIKRELGDAQGIGNSLQSLGAMALEGKDYGTARAYFRESLEIFQRLGKRWTIAHLLLDFANLDHYLLRFDRAIRLSTAANASMKRLGSSFHQGSLNLIALVNREHPFTPAERMHHELEGERMSLEEAVAYVFDDPDALDVALRHDPQASIA